jgi:hypothetical protein
MGMLCILLGGFAQSLNQRNRINPYGIMFRHRGEPACGIEHRSACRVHHLDPLASLEQRNLAKHHRNILLRSHQMLQLDAFLALILAIELESFLDANANAFRIKPKLPSIE